VVVVVAAGVAVVEEVEVGWWSPRLPERCYRYYYWVVWSPTVTVVDWLLPTGTVVIAEVYLLRVLPRLMCRHLEGYYRCFPSQTKQV